MIDLDNGLPTMAPLPADAARRAALAVCDRATDNADARTLLAMLGLLRCLHEPGQCGLECGL